jgi:type IV pilus assembly protein PilQ
VTVAEKYLRNLDLRKRQVAVKVQILNVDLLNDKSIDSSFSARMGNTFIVSQSGKAFMNFGDYKPGNEAGTGRLGSGDLYAAPGEYLAGEPMQAAQDVVGASVASQNVVNPVVESQRVIDPVVASQQVVDPVVESKEVFKPPYVEAQEIVGRKEDGTPIYGPKLDANGIPIYVPSNDPSASPKLVTRYDSSGRPIYVPSTNPATAPTLIPRYDSNGQQIYVPSTDPAATPTLVPRYDSNGQKIYVPSSNPTVAPTLIPRYDSNGRPIYVPSSDPAASPSLVPRYDKNGQPVYVAGKNPNTFKYPQNSIYGYLEAVIQSTSAKTLASPTLLVQEGQEASVETGTSYITGVTATETANGSTQFQNTRQNAGLTLRVNVDKIDDNGFITMNITPSISVPASTDFQEGVKIYNIQSRSLSSGRVRLRDRQTLVLTGVIRESDVEAAKKWPILGDLPILGQFFRKSESEKTKNELVVLVTPSIVDDESGGGYGYGYRPSTREARQLMSPR